MAGSSAPSMPVIVELFGLPGAGKSTITTGLHLAHGMMTREQISEAWQASSLPHRASTIGRAVSDLEWMRSIASVIIRTPVTHRESLARLLRLAATKPWLRSLDGPLLFDQGLLQRLWSIFYTEAVSHPPQPALTRLIRQYYQGLAVQIVMVEVSPETAAQRIQGRNLGTSRLDELPEDTVLAKLRQTAGLPRALLEAAREAGLRVVTLDGSAPPEVLIEQLSRIIAPGASSNDGPAQSLPRQPSQAPAR